VLESIPVYLTLACGAALVAVATAGFGASMALVAVFPLLITRFSFQRYAAARNTLDQTVQALGLVPELAGLVPLGHSERAAVYAGALSDALGFSRVSRQRVITATRLHHLGAVPFDAAAPDEGTPAEPPHAGLVATAGAAILRESGFPADVADLVEQAVCDGDAEPCSLEAAVVRVAGSFDDVVGEDPSCTSRGLSALSAAAVGPDERRVVAALLQTTAATPDLIPNAVAAGERFRAAALDVDLDQLVGAGTGTGGVSGTILPFARRARAVGE